MDHNQSVG